MSELRERCLAFYRKAPHRNILATPVDDLWVFVRDEIFAERARCAAEITSLREAIEAARAFVPEYEAWMDDLSDERELGFYRGGKTFGELRRARDCLAMIEAALGKETGT